MTFSALQKYAVCTVSICHLELGPKIWMTLAWTTSKVRARVSTKWFEKISPLNWKRIRILVFVYSVSDWLTTFADPLCCARYGHASTWTKHKSWEITSQFSAWQLTPQKTKANQTTSKEFSAETTELRTLISQSSIHESIKTKTREAKRNFENTRFKMKRNSFNRLCYASLKSQGFVHKEAFKRILPALLKILQFPFDKDCIDWKSSERSEDNRDCVIKTP